MTGLPLVVARQPLGAQLAFRLAGVGERRVGYVRQVTAHERGSTRWA